MRKGGIKKLINFSFFIPLILIFIGIIIFPLKGVFTSLHSSWYLTQALNIYKGNGFVDASWSAVTMRGPVFPWMIAVFFRLFGVSIVSALSVVRLFFILNTLLIFFIGKKFYNERVGFMASFLMLTSFTINDLSTFILLDTIMPFFVILSIFFLYTAFEKQGYLFFILSGLAMGIAYMTKEMALTFFPLPFLIYIFIKKWRSRKNLIGVSLFFISLSAALFPWFFYIYKYSNSLGNTLGGVGQTALRTLIFSDASNSFNLSAFFSNIIQWTRNYCYLHISERFLLGPLIITAWIFTLFRGIIKKKKNDLMILLSLALFIPLMIFFGSFISRAGQSVFFYLLSYINIAHFLFITGDYLFKKLFIYINSPKPLKFLLRSGGLILFSIILIIEISFERRIISLWTGKLPFGMSYYKKKCKILGWHDQTVHEAGEWIKKHISKGSRFMCDRFWKDLIYFNANGNYPFYALPYTYFSKPDAIFLYKEYRSTRIEKPLFLFPGFNQTNSNNYLKSFRQGDLFSEIKRLKIHYIAITARRGFLSFYFDLNPGFKKIAEFGKGIIKIYKVKKPVYLNNFKTRISRSTPAYLKNLKKNNPLKYSLLKEKFLRGKLGFSEQEIIRLIKGKYSSFIWGQLP